jgi:hypothetical protein
MKFKNNASKYGFYFGRFCVGIGAILILISIPLICNDTGERPINFRFILLSLVGLAIHYFGIYRTGGRF